MAAVEALRSELALCLHELPLAPVEPPIVELIPTNRRTGLIVAPSCPPASCLSFTCLTKCVRPGNSAAFSLSARVTEDDLAPVVARTTLASVLSIEAVLQHSADAAPRNDAVAFRPPPSQLLPVTYAPSDAHGAVICSVAVPVTSPDGSHIVVLRASVAGCDVALDVAPLQVTVGYNHSPAPQGPMYAAAEAGSVMTLMRVLDSGGSTEEKDPVSGTIRP
jgi:hypothetical protein